MNNRNDILNLLRGKSRAEVEEYAKANNIPVEGVSKDALDNYVADVLQNKYNRWARQYESGTNVTAQRALSPRTKQFIGSFNTGKSAPREGNLSPRRSLSPRSSKVLKSEKQSANKQSKVHEWLHTVKVCTLLPTATGENLNSVECAALLQDFYKGSSEKKKEPIFHENIIASAQRKLGGENISTFMAKHGVNIGGSANVTTEASRLSSPKSPRTSSGRLSSPKSPRASQLSSPKSPRTGVDQLSSPKSPRTGVDQLSSPKSPRTSSEQRSARARQWLKRVKQATAQRNLEAFTKTQQDTSSFTKGDDKGRLSPKASNEWA